MPVVTIKSTTPGPCACCGIGGVTMFCRTRGGTASLVGCSEFVSPSTPPKKYRLSQQSGSTQTNYYTPSDSSCSTPPSGNTNCSYSGSTQYNAMTGVPTDSGGVNCGSGLIPGGSQCISCPASSCIHTFSCSPTTIERQVNGNCCFDTSSGVYIKKSGDSLTWTLSDEDTDDDAVARLLAGGGGTWSGYTQTGDGSSGTCVPASCCRANYQQRTGFSFGYQESQFKLVMTLLDPSTNYVVNVEVYRRLSGSSDPWALLLVSPFGFTSDGSGNFTITDQDVPNLEGYETFACCALVYKS